MKLTLSGTSQLIAMCIGLSHTGVDLDVKRREEAERNDVVESEIETDVVDIVVDGVTPKLGRSNRVATSVHFHESR